MNSQHSATPGHQHRAGETTRLGRAVCKIGAIVLVSAMLAPAAHAQVFNSYMSGEGQLGTAPTPIMDGSRGYDWSNPPWQTQGPAALQDDGRTICGTIAGDHVIRGGGQFRSFGMDNWFIDEDWVKTFTVEFDFDGGVPTAGMAADAAQGGTHPESNYNGAVADRFLREVLSDTDNDGVNDHYKLQWEFDPQPDWEFVTIQNVGAGPMTLSNITLKSVCVPTPGAISLAALAGLVAVRRRRAGRA